ncbi:MAG: 2-amino-4-hydroxy-6-hydroxymethyldihydropteridine diphosphokinase [Byssovorax sp.]
MDHIRRIVIGLGSNLGDRQANIVAAVDQLRTDRDLHVLRRSPLYETPPAGGPPQGDYLNGAVLIVTALDARELLDRLLVIERSLGRTRPDAERWGPRTIDLDVLWIEGEAVDEADLHVPHPRLRERVFALRPLLDVAPDATDFVTGKPFADEPVAKEPIRRFADGTR